VVPVAVLPDEEILELAKAREKQGEQGNKKGAVLVGLGAAAGSVGMRRRGRARAARVRRLAAVPPAI